MSSLSHTIPLLRWAPNYRREDLRRDLIAGFTISALLIPQGLAYALLAGLPPQIGLYASIAPVIAYAVFGTSRQLAVGPVAIVSLMTATTLGKLYEHGSESYLAAAAVLALLVGLVHLVLRFGRLGFVTNFLSHSVLVGFTAASALIIVASQIKHVLGISIPNSDSVVEATIEVGTAIDQTHLATLALGVGCIVAFLLVKRFAKRVPAALVVLLGSIVVMNVFDLDEHGVKTVGDIPSGLPGFSIPTLDGGAVGSLAAAAVAITLVGYMESIAVAKVYARRHSYEVDPNQELVGLGMANIASGLFGGYPVTGASHAPLWPTRPARRRRSPRSSPRSSSSPPCCSSPRSSVRSPRPLSVPRSSSPSSTSFDIAEMRRIAHEKRSDLIGLVISFGATLTLGIELGVVVAIVASMFVVFARMARPHFADVDRIPASTRFRTVERAAETTAIDGLRVVRSDQRGLRPDAKLTRMP